MRVQLIKSKPMVATLDPKKTFSPRPFFQSSRGITVLSAVLLLVLGFLSWKLIWKNEQPWEAVPRVSFTEVTREAGIHFIHKNGAYGEKLLPETMGGGCAFFDFDNDRDQDLFLVNSAFWPWQSPPEKSLATLALYANDGQGRFTDVTAGSGLDITLYGMGVAVGDYDNDGWVDLFISAVGENKLFRNLGQGRFSDVTDASGLGGSAEAWSTACAWLDYDNDADLDLFVGNYVQWSREIDLQVNYQLVGVGRAYGPPMNFPGTFPYLYRNEGQGRFSEVAEASGLHVKKPGTGLPMAKTLGVSPVDFDQDGWIDLIVANDTVQNFVFHNQGNGTFREMGALSGIAFDNYGGARGAMGIDSSPIQEGHYLAVAIGNFANEMTALYVSRRDPFIFSDEAISQGIGNPTRPLLTFGVFFFDFDLDGWLDLLTANGHIEPEIERVRPQQTYLQPTQLFWNAQGHQALKTSGFIHVPAEKSGSALWTPMVGRGAAYADIDGDGDLDVLVTQISGPVLLLRNDQQLDHHWVRIKLVGTRSNRDGIGAWIHLKTGQNTTLSRQVMPTRGYLSQSELPVTFGLGYSDRIQEVKVVWPGGAEQKIDSLRLDRLNFIHQEE